MYGQSKKSLGYWISAMLLLLIASNGYPHPQPKTENKPTTQDKRGTQESPLIIHGDVTTKTAEKTVDEREKEKGKIEVDRAIAQYTGLTAAATGALVVVTAVLAWFTYRLWQAAQRQAGAAHEALVIAERANLSVGQWHDFSIQPGSTPRVQFHLINSGRAHAQIIEFRLGYKIATRDEIPHFPLPAAAISQVSGLVPPRDRIDIDVPFRESLSQDQFSHIMARRVFIFLIGEVTYIDVFRWTCVYRFGAQIGYHGNGVFGAEFIPGPNYNSIHWSKPTNETG